MHENKKAEIQHAKKSLILERYLRIIKLSDKDRILVSINNYK